MPNPINNNSSVLATRIANDAKAAGMSPAELQQLGQKLMQSFNQTSMDVSMLPSIREHAATMASALTMATNELAANTAPDPFLDGGVTA